MSTDKERERKRDTEYRRRQYRENPEYRKKRREYRRRYQVSHRAEINERRRRRWATDPDHRARLLARAAKTRRFYMLRQYGISPEEYDRILALQNGVCAICRKKPNRRLLYVDHCHRTGKVRGLLCMKCNSALGLYEDDPNLTEAATAYLRAALAGLTDYRSFKPRGKIMPSTDEQTETGKGCRLMRSAILLELQCQPGEASDGATDKLRLIARRLVDKAAEGDIQAIKEVLDRIDGKSVPGPDDAEQGPRQVSIRWKNPVASPAGSPADNSSPSTSGRGGSPAS